MLALLVIFNHRYDENLPKLDALLKPRFDNVFYIVPFYDGNRKDVISVYGRSVFFETYIAQAYNILKDTSFDHFMVIADDMILNPNINQNNYLDFFGLDFDQSFIPMLRPLHEMPYYWIGTMSAFTYSTKQKYVEIDNELPSVEQANQLMLSQGINIRRLSRKELFHEMTFRHKYMGDKLRLCLRLLTFLRHPFKRYYELNYPLVGSYSDFLIVAGKDMASFAHYCGVFGATSLFVEVAIPTALVLASSHKILTEDQCKYHGRSYWAVRENVFCEASEYTWDNLKTQYKSLHDIINNFPKDAIYLHPIKLSKYNEIP